jgi:C-terminal processing protease CtpA/Prc
MEYTLANGMYKVVVPVKMYTGSLDRPIERRGLEPDVAVRCTAADLASGKDTVLETARNWLVAGNDANSPP